MWPFNRRGPSGFSSSSTAEEVTEGIDGTGLTAIVTGASSGIGTETARVLALRGVHVVMGVRNLSAGHNVRETIIKDTPTAKVDVLELDLSSMASVKKFAAQFGYLNLPLNILINNAGIMATPFSCSHDGIELQFATNHRFFNFVHGSTSSTSIIPFDFSCNGKCHFLLTHLLVEKMKNTACSGNVEGRIVNVSSEGHRLTYPEGIRFDKINDESGYQWYLAYGQSKLANILHIVELSRHFKEEGVNITANSLHPGVIVTNLFRYNGLLNAIMSTAGKLVMKNVQQGAATTCYVALHPQVKGVTGKYFSNSNVANPSSKTSDTVAEQLWDFSMDIVSPWL